VRSEERGGGGGFPLRMDKLVTRYVEVWGPDTSDAAKVSSEGSFEYANEP
jgi:hypothetical protein